MSLNETKKILYRENPIAKFLYYRKNHLYYMCECSIDKTYFEIPVSDIGETTFENEIPAKLLIRWISEK